MRMIKGNVERIVEDQVKADRLLADGFEHLDVVEAVQPETLDGSEMPPEAEKNLEDMTVPELKALAKEKGIDGTSSLNREDLLAVLKDVV